MMEGRLAVLFLLSWMILAPQYISEAGSVLQLLTLTLTARVVVLVIIRVMFLSVEF